MLTPTSQVSQARSMDGIRRSQSIDFTPRMPLTIYPDKSYPLQLPRYRSRFWRLYWMAVVSGALVVGAYSVVQQVRPDFWHLSYSIAQAVTRPNILSQTQQPVQAIVAAHPELTIGVSAIDVDTGQRITMGSAALFTAASTTKVLTAVSYLRAVQNGSASLDELIGDYTAEYQLKQMVNQSNNESYDFFKARLGSVGLENYAKSIGLASYQIDANTMSAPDQASLLEQLASGKVLNSQNTARLLSYMQGTNNEELIPAGLPNGATVYHKYGELNGLLHDSAIIKKNGRTIAVAIYTQGAAGDYGTRADIIRQLTRAVTAGL